jgi:phosphocarrier protein
VAQAMHSRQMQITNQLGMHARAAARFVRIASTYKSKILVAREDRVMDGKSIMGLLLLTAACGTMITISAEGPDAVDAVASLSRLVERGFEEP